MFTIDELKDYIDDTGMDEKEGSLLIRDSLLSNLEDVLIFFNSPNYNDDEKLAYLSINCLSEEDFEQYSFLVSHDLGETKEFVDQYNIYSDNVTMSTIKKLIQIELFIRDLSDVINIASLLDDM